MKRVRRLFLLLLTLSIAYLTVGVGAAEDKKPNDVHDPANAVANLEIGEGLEAILSASEESPVKPGDGGLTNPTNIDIDYRGRLWVCDVMNYRGNNGKRPEGDRILILEDTDGDGKMDKQKVFYQGRDIDSAMGICVLGNKVIVSCSPNIWVFTVEEGTDKVLKKEVMFTKTGDPQHDHSAHSFLFGPDGKLYWNVGNTGKHVHDKDGKVVVDKTGNNVVDNGKPYFGGMPFRCNMDGSEFEVLGHNFRNNYEVTVDSFGSLWQSDNDDDGNRGVRINFVMEFGNFGYRDEMTGAGWGVARTNMESEVPLRHWHLNDPGVVPNLLQTGAGSPTGICFYEGTLLPKVFRNHVIHCDAGPSIVRCYPAKKSGAGYSAEMVTILDGSKKNNWFRPADVCVAPDGSLFVSDWYDPGVGGHAQRNIDRGRIFRVAPPGTKYQTPKFDFKSAKGAVEALQNPNLAVRYLAWTALHEMGKGAEEELTKLWNSKEVRQRARALWLLGKIEGRGSHYVDLAVKDEDPDIRIVGLRLARQLKDGNVLGVVSKLVNDRASEVRRECALALRHNKSKEAAKLWAELAQQHDGNDRWYLEALGIAADRQWDDFLEVYLRRVASPWSSKTSRDIVWRSRATKTPELLASIAGHKTTPTEEYPRLMRAFDFQADGVGKDEALLKLVSTDIVDETARKFVATEALRRLKNVDFSKKPEKAAVLEKVLEGVRGTQTFVDLVNQFNVTKQYPELLALAVKNQDAQLTTNAMRTLLEKKQEVLIAKALDDKDPKQVAAVVQALTTVGDARTVPMLLAFAGDEKRDVELRRQAIRALAKSKPGAEAVLELEKKKKLHADLKQVAGFALTTGQFTEVKAEAGKLFPLPPAKDNKPLPPFNDLVKMKGDGKKGKELFKTVGTCANCHIVNGEGKDVGPNLSEIGKKLARDALLESILYPSAAISHSYETYQVETKSGITESGLLVSDTPEMITIKNQEGLQKSFKKKDVDDVRKSPTSLMPADLQKVLSAEDIVDVVEYLITLKEAKGSKN